VIGISVIFCPSANSDNCSLKFIFLIVPFSLLCHSLLVGMRSDDGWGRTLVLEGLFSVEMPLSSRPADAYDRYTVKGFMSFGLLC